MSEFWLNFQYMIEFSYGNQKDRNGLCYVTYVNGNAVKHGTSSYIETPVRGDPVKHYVYGGSYTEPLNISIILGEGARPWLKWFSDIQTGQSAETRNITLSLYKYGSQNGAPDSGQLWLKWDLINCFPVSWQMKPFSIEEGPSPMQIDIVLQFESMIVSDGDQEMLEIMG